MPKPNIVKPLEGSRIDEYGPVRDYILAFLRRSREGGIGYGLGDKPEFDETYKTHDGTEKKKWDLTPEQMKWIIDFLQSQRNLYKFGPPLESDAEDDKDRREDTRDTKKKFEAEYGSN